MRILFVCLGNICRSPMAEGIFRDETAKRGLKIEFDSCGTGGWHVGESPDRRAQECMRKHDHEINDLRARQFSREDFDRFDRIYVMDLTNRDDVLELARTIDDRKKVRLLLDEVAPGAEMPVPDPYFGGDHGFEHVYNLIHQAATNVLDELESNEG